MPRLTAAPLPAPSNRFWVVNAAVAALEFYGVADVVIRALLDHLHRGPLLAALVVGFAALAVVHRMIQVQPRRWAWIVCIAIQVAVAAALVVDARRRPFALVYLVVPGTGLSVLASETARRFYLRSSTG